MSTRMMYTSENIRVSIYAYVHTRVCTISTYTAVHGIMLSGETRLSRILKGFNNIWKLLPKSWRSSSSLRYVLGATLGIRPIHLLFLSLDSLSFSLFLFYCLIFSLLLPFSFSS